MNRTDETKAIVLLSGGLDSSTTLAKARHDGFEIVALTFRYGQRHPKELDAAKAQAERQGVLDHVWLDLDLSVLSRSALTGSGEVPKNRPVESMSEDVPPTYVPARNTIFLACALALAETRRIREIYLGINSVDFSGYPDCRPEFIKAFERLASVATHMGLKGEGFRINAPLLHMSKTEIIRLGWDLGVDFGRTWSCYDPTDAGRPCERCDACLLRARGFLDAGLSDPLSRGAS